METFIADPHPQVSDLGGLGWGLRICISNKFPHDVSAGSETGAFRTSILIMVPVKHRHKEKRGSRLTSSLPQRQVLGH